MATKKCTVCGKEFVKKSNRQMYCPECKDIMRLSKKRDAEKGRRARLAFLDKAPVQFSAHCPKNVADNWDIEARKVLAEKKRTFKRYRGLTVPSEDTARKDALDNFTVDQRDADEWKGSIEDFFNMKDDE